MDANRTPLKMAGFALTLIVLLGYLCGWFFTTPPQQKYPDREPIRFWHMWTAEWQVLIEDICTNFNEIQEVYEVIPLSIPRGAADSKFLLSVAGGAPPDCMAQWNQLVPQFADRNLIMSFDELMSKRELASFYAHTYPVAKKIALYKGRPYCMPLDLNVRACFYRLDHLKEAGLLPADTPERITTKTQLQNVNCLLPRTMEELSLWGDQLHRFDPQGRLIRLGFAPQRFINFATVFGGGFYDWEQNKLLIDTPENLRALSYLTESNRAIGFDRMQRFNSSLTGNFGSDWPFATGKRSIVVDGQWRVQQLKKYAPGVSYTAAPIPPPAVGGKKHAGWVYSNFMIIPTGAKNPKGAWAFIKFWMGLDDPDRAADFYTRAGWLPASPQISKTETYRAYVRAHPQFQTFIDLLASPNIEPTPPVPFQLLLFDQIKQVNDAALSGRQTPEQALHQLDMDITGVLNRRKNFEHEK